MKKKTQTRIEKLLETSPFQNINLIEVPDYGQIGAGQVVEFTPRNDRTSKIARPPNTHENDILFTYTVCGDSLLNPFDRGAEIYNGDLLICKGNFALADVTPNRICVVFIHTTCERIAKKVRFDGDSVYLSATNPDYKDRVYSADAVEIKGIVISFQRMVF